MTAEAGIQFVEPGQGQADLGATYLSGLEPQVVKWVPRLLESLRPVVRNTVCQLVRSSSTPASSRIRVVNEVLFEKTDTDPSTLQDDIGAETLEYFFAAADDALRRIGQDPEPTFHTAAARAAKHADQTLTRIGTGQGPRNAPTDALAHGPAALLACRDSPPVVTLSLDGPTWTDTNRDVIERSLSAFDYFGAALDIRIIASPSVRQDLRRRFPDWLADHILTEKGDREPKPPHDGEHGCDDAIATAWERAEELSSGSGRVRLLSALDAETPRTAPELARNPDVDLSRGTVGRYLPALEEKNLVSVDRVSKRNQYTLTAVGETLVEDILDEDCRFVHPDQTELETSLTGTPQDSASTVYRAAPAHDGSPPARRPAEAWLAETGTPDQDAAYVQWLGGPSDILDAWAMHDRLAAGKRGPGITLVDDEIAAFEDGRVSYLSCFEDHAQVVCQWGGPLATLGRLVGVLLSDRALSTILSQDRVGPEFEELYKEIEEDIVDILQRGAQVGWLSEDDLVWEDWYDRWTGNRTRFLERLGELIDTDDMDCRAALFKDLHGILASATALYRAADIELTIHLRIPDTEMLSGQPNSLQDFTKFIKYTVPKSTAYGVHNAHRQILEHRSEKLKSRLPVDVSSEDPTADFCADWVVSGPSATELRADLETALAGIDATVREAVQNGNEDAPTIEVPIHTGNSYAAVKQVIRRRATKKGYVEARQTESLRRLVRVCDAILGTADRGPSPFDVAELLLRLEQYDRPGDGLYVSDIASGLGQLHPSRLFPEAPPTIGKMVGALLKADEPLGRADLIETAGISASSYDRHWETLAAFELIERTEDRQWRARVMPLWADLEDLSGRKDGVDSLRDWRDVCYDVAMALGTDVDQEAWEHPIHFEDIVATIGLSAFQPLLAAYSDAIYRSESLHSETIVIIGNYPAGSAPSQSTLHAPRAD